MRNHNLVYHIYMMKLWFGADVNVLACVTIGNGSIIEIGSVVTKSIPTGVIAAGNLCKVI